jgi:NAD(P)-binding Rossmann-like domain
VRNTGGLVCDADRRGSVKSLNTFDVVIVGSGINSLVCAAMLVRKGKRVCVLERNAVASGCIRTEEITMGFRHDLFSMSYPLFVMSPHYPLLKDGLEEGGLKFVSGGMPTGVVLPDGRSLVFSQTRDENVAAHNELGDDLGVERPERPPVNLDADVRRDDTDDMLIDLRQRLAHEAGAVGHAKDQARSIRIGEHDLHDLRASRLDEGDVVLLRPCHLRWELEWRPVLHGPGIGTVVRSTLVALRPWMKSLR